MPFLQRNVLLFAVIFIEGYAVLASELVAIRLLIPFVGSGVEMVAIVVSAVLLPLAAGYHFGGRRYHALVAKAKAAGKSPVVSVRKLLIKNLLNATLCFTLGLSYLFLVVLFSAFTSAGIEHNLAQTALYCLLFLIFPVFLLAQTVPLMTNYFSHAILSRLTGRMLFFSTLGSFMGSVISTLILMNWVGVQLTAFVIVSLLFLSLCLLCKHWYKLDLWIAGGCVAVMFLLNNPSQLRDFNIVSNNAYNTVAVKNHEDGETTLLQINHSPSSIYSPDSSKRFKYVQFIEKTILEPAKESKRVLILGAGGFTIGFDESHHHYTYVDIDKDLKEISEEHLLPHALGENQQFIAKSARAFLNENKDQYDIIIVDAYTNAKSIPMEMTTLEFWQKVDEHLLAKGVMVANVIMKANYSDLYAVRMTNTISEVFPQHTRQAVEPYSIWSDTDGNNVLFIHKKNGYSDDHLIYTDNLNPYSMDMFR